MSGNGGRDGNRGNPAPPNSEAGRRRETMRQTLREKLQGTEYLRQLGEIADGLRAVYDELSRYRHAYDQTKVMNCRARIEALKARADLNFRRLAKVLPDLRAVELSGAEGQDLFEALAEAVRDARRDEPAWQPPDDDESAVDGDEPPAGGRAH